jgi:hypothetical protein
MSGKTHCRPVVINDPGSPDASITPLIRQSQSTPATPGVVINPYKRSSSISSGGENTSSSKIISRGETDTAGNSSSHQPSVANSTGTPTSKNATAASSIINPYKRDSTKKFIGGAEQARRAARKPTRIQVPQDEQKGQVLPLAMNPFDRFFSAILRCSPQELLETTVGAQNCTWETICNRVGLQVPTAPVQSCYTDPALHFAVRAALVLEEARNSLHTELLNSWQRKNGFSNNKKIINVRAHYIEIMPNGHAKISFFKSQTYIKEELYDIRPGQVYLCQPRDLKRSIDNVVLGVVTTANAATVEKTHIFQVTIFRPIPNGAEGAEWSVTPIAGLITELRSFEAVSYSGRGSLSFLHPLLGGKSPTHTRFDSDEDRDKTKAKKEPQTIISYFTQQPKHPAMFNLPRLNDIQEAAALSFLKAAPGTISLVQGPPGTGMLTNVSVTKKRKYPSLPLLHRAGKTTLLVSIICRYLEESLAMSSSSKSDGSKAPVRRRLLVCAPTNKAVSVLALRFLAAMNQDCCPCNIILAGDADKLLGDEKSTFRSDAGGEKSRRDYMAEHRELQSIFLYSWLQVVSSEYQKIQAHADPKYQIKGLSREELYLTAKRTESRMTNSLIHLPEHILKAAAAVTAALEGSKSSGSLSTVAVKVGRLIGHLKEMPNDKVWKDLMNSADVIFCTLACAGGMVFKRTNRINDLIVDEAAASTEPELYIPFHLNPSRLLAVGDPLQLPATVMSRRAVELGLAKSLHERRELGSRGIPVPFMCCFLYPCNDCPLTHVLRLSTHSRSS